jgi:cation transport regulator ChaC
VEIEDESEDEQIEGVAYLVQSEEHAEKLAEFETDLYVSVHVEITLEGGRSVVGRTFAKT